MFNLPAKIKPGDIKINNSLITMSCLFPLDITQLISIFNKAGYEVQLPIKPTDVSFMAHPIVNIAYAEDFKLDYFPEKKLLQLVSTGDSISTAFETVVNIISESKYNLLRNVIYFELLYRIQSIHEVPLIKKLLDIQSQSINQLASIFGFSTLYVNGLLLGSERNTITQNWFGFRVNPAYALGEKFYDLEIVYRSDKLTVFKQFLQNINTKVKEIKIEYEVVQNKIQADIFK